MHGQYISIPLDKFLLLVNDTFHFGFIFSGAWLIWMTFRRRTIPIASMQTYCIWLRAVMVTEVLFDVLKMLCRNWWHQHLRLLKCFMQIVDNIIKKNTATQTTGPCLLHFQSVGLFYKCHTFYHLVAIFFIPMETGLWQKKPHTFFTK